MGGGEGGILEVNGGVDHIRFFFVVEVEVREKCIFFVVFFFHGRMTRNKKRVGHKKEGKN